MKYKYLGMGLVFSAVFVGSIAFFHARYDNQQNNYKSLLNTKIQKYLEQQQILLQTLAEEITPLLARSDITNISRSLRVFEDQMFVLAKLQLTVPVGVSFVSLNVPTQFITSSGLSKANILAPDENYYLATLGTPNAIHWSMPYTEEVMPMHQLINLGLGVMLDEQYLGQLDAHMSLSSLDAYLRLDPKLGQLLDFSLSKGLHAPLFKVRPHAYLQAVILPAGLQTIIILCLVLLIYYAQQLYVDIKVRQRAAFEDRLKITNWQDSSNMYAAILQTQYKYGELYTLAPFKEAVNIQELLCDAIAVNADLIKERNIHVSSPEESTHKHLIQANRLRMMQILSGILYETINQLPDDSSIELQLEVKNIDTKYLNIEFRLSDDGFYTELLERTQLNSTADVRAKGWEKIKQLIAAEHGKLEYIHTAYAGNTIVLAFTQPRFNNVINLAF